MELSCVLHEAKHGHQGVCVSHGFHVRVGLSTKQDKCFNKFQWYCNNSLWDFKTMQANNSDIKRSRSLPFLLVLYKNLILVKIAGATEDKHYQHGNQ